MLVSFIVTMLLVLVLYLSPPCQTEKQGGVIMARPTVHSNSMDLVIFPGGPKEPGPDSFLFPFPGWQPSSLS